VTLVADAAGAHRAANLLAEVWDATGPGLPMSAHLIRALAHTGNYVAGAWAGQDLVGASVGFLGLEQGVIDLHSHITGVARRAQGRHVGLALKQHQRAWALERGIGEITWSFDPLVRRNAWFNLVRLRAVAVGYHPDFYGPMEDGINAGDESDRCLVRWDLKAAEVVAAAVVSGGHDSEPSETPPGALVWLDQDSEGDPVVVGDRLAGDVAPDGAGPRLCRMPADIEALRAGAPDRARAWRRALRATLGAAMSAGWVAGAVTREGCYVLTRPTTGD
jgi:predicted GNAT superfamily acetyltransferase